MSTDFTFAQVGPECSPGIRAANIEERLHVLGYTRSSRVVEAALDERGVFEEKASELSIEDPLASKQAALSLWRGMALEFFNREFTVYVMLGVSNNLLYAFIDVSGKVIDQLVDEGALDRFWQIVVAVASACESVGGYGGFEQPFEPFSTTESINRIFGNDEGVPSVLGLVPVATFEQRNLRGQAENDFHILQSTLGYYLLQNKDLD